MSVIGSSVVVPTSEADRKKIMNAVIEISDSMSRIEAEKDLIKNILETLKDEHDMPPKYMRKVANLYHRQSLNEFKAESTEVEDLYEALTSAK